MAAPNPKRQREETERLRKLFVAPQTALVVHYACQSFDHQDHRGSPRVAAVALRNLYTGSTQSFSIHQEMDLTRGTVPLDQCERAMLTKFFHFLQLNKTMQFVHWNMRDLKFGFPALEHRLEVLGVEPFRIEDSHKLDLSMMLTHLYGTDYLPRPHFETLAQRNNFNLAGFVPGQHEPMLFAQGKYREVLQSTLCKVTLIADVAQRAHDGTLKTDASMWTMNVGRLREAYETFHNNPVKAWAGLILSGLVAGWGMVLKLF